MRFYPDLDDVKILKMPARRWFALLREIPKLQAEEDLRALMLEHNPYSKQPQRLVDQLKGQATIGDFSSVTTQMAKSQLKSMARRREFADIITVVKKEPEE